MDRENVGVEFVGTVTPELYAAVLSVNADRAAVGLPPLPVSAEALDAYMTEFGLLGKGWGRFKDWVKGQVNNPEFEKKIRRGKGGKFTEKPGAYLDERSAGDVPEERARLDIGTADRGRTIPTAAPSTGTPPAADLDAMNVENLRWDAGGKRRPRPRSSPTVGLTKIDIARSRQELLNAGFTGEQIARWQGRGSVYRADTGPDLPPMYTFIASPRAMVESGSFLQRRDLASAVTQLSTLEHIRKNYGSDPDLDEKIELQKRRVAALSNSLKARIRQLEQAYGPGSSETISAWDEDVAAEMVALAAQNIRNAYRPDQRTTPFMIELDESKLVKETARLDNYKNRGLDPLDIRDQEAKARSASPFDVFQGLFHEGLNRGQTDRGNIIIVNRAVARTPISETSNYRRNVAPTRAETVGQDFMNHEPGHGIDVRNSPWSSENEQFKSFMEMTQALFPEDTYIQSNEREWFAEMYKIFSLGTNNPAHQLAARAFANLFIIDPNMPRPPFPPSRWAQLNQEWLVSALAAQQAGRPIPPIPSADFSAAYRAAIQRMLNFR